MELINIANRIERVADLTTNIAEDVVYIVTGEVIKHHRTGEPNPITARTDGT